MYLLHYTCANLSLVLSVCSFSQSFGRVLQSLKQLSDKSNLTSEDVNRVSGLITQLLELIKEDDEGASDKEKEEEEEIDDEEEEEEVVLEKVKVPNCVKLMQINLKNEKFGTQGIDGECITMQYLCVCA